MVRPTANKANSFDVYIELCADGGCSSRTWLPLAQSTNNSMVPNTILMGMEVSGSVGVSAQKANFTETIYLDPAAPFGGRFLTSEDVQVVPPGPNNPITSGWDPWPSASNFGGSFFTTCCQ
jgi:hypothetical protein